jgi:outer membrane protein OmpA-like peptidoglycan-associated protein
VLVAGGSGQVQLGLTAPAADGGMPVTGYTIVDSLHGITQSAVAGVNTVSGLTNGVTYDFNAVAINGVGPSTVSTAVTVTPAGAPTAPRLRPVVKWYTLQAVVTAPADSGGRPITGYTATLSRTGMVTKTVNLTAAGTATFTGLTPRTGYHVQVVARNAVGTSAAAAVNVTTSALPAPIPIPRTPTAMTGGESQILSGLGLFPTGSATPTAAARGHLAVLARELGAATVISCAGYTDSAGSPLANYLVALARAHAVCAVLRTDGVRATESMVSYGQTHPVATGRNQPANSRVVVMFVR